MIRNYFKIAWRNLLRHRLSSGINIIGLTIGMSCCLVIHVFITYEATFDKFQSNYGEIYRVVQHTEFPDQVVYWNTTPYPLAEALRNDLSGVDRVTQISGPVGGTFELANHGEEAEFYDETSILFIDTHFPQVFDIQWLRGDPKTALTEANSVVLTESLVQKYFGKEISLSDSVLGKSISYNGSEPLLITGVVADPAPNTNLSYSALIPYDFFRSTNPELAGNWNANHQGSTYVMVDREKDQKNIEAEIAGLKSKYLKAGDATRISYFLQPLSEIHNETKYGNNIGGYTMPKKVLFLAALVGIFILFLAIINFVNLLTAQALSRSKEVGIRKVLGSSRKGLIKQFLIENTLLILLVLILSVILSQYFLNLINNALSVINLQLTLQGQDIGFLFLVGGIIIIAAAVYPALSLSSYKPIQALKNKMAVAGKNRSLNFRRSLTAIQFLVVQILIMGTIIVASQMNYFQNKDLGFSSEAIVIIPNPDPKKRDLFRSTLLKNKGITEVAFGSGPPMAVEGLSLGTRYRLPQQTEEEGLETEIKIGDANYLNLFDLHLLAGRNFSHSKEDFEFIVNETLVTSEGWTPEEAIGKQLVINEGTGTIAGVVSDYHNTSLQTNITPTIITNWNFFLNSSFIKLKNTDAASLTAIEKAFNKTFPSAVFSYTFLDDSIAREYVLESSIFSGFKVFSALAIAIACLGLFGFMAFIAVSKTKEVGIRKMLGSSVFQIICLISKEYVLLIFLSFLIATPIVYYMMQQWLQHFTYRIEPAAWMFISGGVLTLIIAFAASAYQLFKAATVNPVKSLKTE